jgi:Xaa-Pro dipeptidase
MVCAQMDAPWLGEGNVRPAMIWRWAEGAEQSQVDKMAKTVHQVLVENGVQNEQVGIDVMDMMAYQAFSNIGVRLVNAWPAMTEARVIKTPDELESLKIAAAHGDAAMWMAMNEWAKPGVTEREVSAKVNEFLYRRGFDVVYDIIVASGGNTSPYRRWATDKLLRVGDLVIIDINAVGPGGYFIDFVRCFKVGGVKPTQQEKDLYKECYDFLYRAIDKMKPGNTTADVAKEFPVYDDDKYGTVSLQQFAHSIGLTLYEGMWISRAYSMQYPAEIKPNMYFAIETFAGHPGLEQTVRLEENLVITDTGNAITTFCPHPTEFFE